MPQTQIERNHFFIPQSAPRINGYGEFLFAGGIHFEGNQYATDGNGRPPFRATYDPTSIVVNDRFPTNGSIIPIRFSDGRHYTLSAEGYLNFISAQRSQRARFCRRERFD